jgi:hypothetical protein
LAEQAAFNRVVLGGAGGIVGHGDGESQAITVDSGRCRSAFRNDVDQGYELMPITIPTRCRSQIA